MLRNVLSAPCAGTLGGPLRPLARQRECVYCHRQSRPVSTCATTDAIFRWNDGGQGRGVFQLDVRLSLSRHWVEHSHRQAPPSNEKTGTLHNQRLWVLSPPNGWAGIIRLAPASAGRACARSSEENTSELQSLMR